MEMSRVQIPPVNFFFFSKKDELQREEENQGSADMTNGHCVHVEPRHPLETAACVSAEYLPGNFFSLNWDMTQSWSGHGRDTMKKKKKKKHGSA